MEAALFSARLIGAAVGVTMTTYRVTYNAALEMLRTISQTDNIKLRDLAERVISTGTAER